MSDSSDDEDDGEGMIALIERISAVKNCFEDFNIQLKDGPLAGGDDEEERAPVEPEDQTIDEKIAKFESLIGRLHTVVDKMQLADADFDDLDDEDGEGGRVREEDLYFDIDGDEEDDEPDAFAETFATQGANPSVTEYEKLIQNLLVPFLDAVNAVGGEVQRQGAYVAQAFGAQHEMLEEVSGRQKPNSEEELLVMLHPTQEALACIDQINAEAGTLRKHTAMVAGAMTAFGWVTAQDPKQYIGDMLNAVPVYGRQILGEYPGIEHTALIESLKYMLRGLQDYVTEHHARGLVWNSKHQPYNSRKKRSPHKIFTTDNEAIMDSAHILAALDEFILDKVVPFVEAAYALQKESVRVQTDFVQKAFKAQRDFMTYVVRCRRPPDSDLSAILAETSDALTEIECCCDNTADERLHLTMVASGMPCLAWVSIPMNPSAYIADMINSIPVYGDKILREAANKEDGEEEMDAAFVELFKEMLKGLNDYVRIYHPKGLAWNMGGEDLLDVRLRDQEELSLNE